MSKSKYTIARYKAKGLRFEILVDPDKAFEYKKGKEIDISEILVYEAVYTDAKKGLKPSRKDLLDVFRTDDLKEVAKAILDRGELLLTSEQRERLLEDKKRQVTSYISRYCIDARTGAPIPPARVLSAMEEVGVKIDPFREVEEQLPEIISKISQVIPIKKSVTKIALKIPAAFSAKAYGHVKSSGEVENEKWLSDGSYYAEVSIPAGFKQEFVEKLLNLTKGSAIVEVLEERTI